MVSETLAIFLLDLCLFPPPQETWKSNTFNQKERRKTGKTHSDVSKHVEIVSHLMIVIISRLSEKKFIGVSV
jgi:hypothetical protein